MKETQHPATDRRGRVQAIVAVIALLLTIAPLAAADEPPPVEQDVPSFNESPGCGPLDGFRGPLASRVGILEMTEPIYGPWADFYGRSIQSVWDQLVRVQLPGQSKTIYVHERVFPAFEMVLDNLAEEAASGHTYTITSNTWSWSRYTIPPTRKLSFHTVGAAIDVNSTTNPYSADNVLITDMPDWFVEAWTSAGWCWGGDWQSIKDPMHFSWMGPIHTPGYEMPAPQPPLVGTASFQTSIPLRTGLAPIVAADHRNVVADTDRDGAADVVRVEPFGPGGEVGIRSAVALHSHETCSIAGITETAPADAGAPMLVDDLSGDARPDLTSVLEDGGTLTLEVFTNRQWGPWRRTTIDTAIPARPGSAYLLDDADRDGSNDLFVISPDSHVDIWAGPGFGSQLAGFDLEAGVGDRFTTGDRDVDGFPDLLVLDGDGTMTVHLAADGWEASETVATGADDPAETAWGTDLDGDGHTDLVMVSPEGDARLLRGGASTHNPGVWYLQTEDHWLPRRGCLDPAVDAMAMPRVPSASAGSRTVVAVPEYPGHTRYLVMDGAATLREKHLSGVPVDITSVTYRGEPVAYLLLDAGDRFKAKPLVVTEGPRPDTFRFKRHEAIEIAGITGGIAVLQAIDGAPKARVLVRRFGGGADKLRFGIDPVSMAASDEAISVFGVTRTDRARIVVKSPAGGRLAARSFSPGLVPVSLARIPGGYLAALRDGDSIVIHRLDETLATLETVTVNDVATAAVTPTAGGFLIARATPAGDGLVESRRYDGSITWWHALAAGYAPAALTDAPLVAVTGQRPADGAAILVLFDPGTGDIAYSDTLP